MSNSHTDSSLSSQQPIYSESIARNYSQVAKEHPWWKHCDTFTTHKLLGDITGLSVLDMGCGEGRHVQNILDWGASKVVGVDVSQHMIDVAQKKNIRNSVFLKCDLTKLQTQIWEQRFDLVTTFWVMQHMSCYDQLYNFINTAFMNLKEGGYFCGITPAYDEKFPLCGVQHTMGGSYRRDSVEPYSVVHCTLTDQSESNTVSMTEHSIYPSHIHKIIKEVGFTNVENYAMDLSKEGEKYIDRVQLQKDMSHVFVFRAQK